MKVVVVGTGYVGLVSAVCLAEIGHNVICIDKNIHKIASLKQGQSPIFEPGIEELLQRQINIGHIQFSVFEPNLIEDCDILMIAVWTPTNDVDGNADLSAVDEVVENYAPHLKNEACIIIKSTVPIGTNKQITQTINDLNLNNTIYIASNPEFLREGAAINDFMNPDRIVVGASSPIAYLKLRTLYQPLIDRKTTYIETDITSAEIIKYAANAFLATKITFINEMANLCDQVGGDVTQVALGMGSDQRIGPLFLHAGPGYGGSCFPKDTKALQATALASGVNLNIINQVIQTNNQRFNQIANQITQLSLSGSEHSKIGFLGLTFKANTDDIRESPAIEIISRMKDLDLRLSAYDPKAHQSVRHIIPFCDRVDTIDAVLRHADMVVIATEWDEFKQIDPAKFVELMNKPCVFDLRNLFDPHVMQKAGIEYHSLGRPLC